MSSDQKVSMTYYTPSLSKTSDENYIILKTSGWDGNVHWTGSETVGEKEPDFIAWKWIVDNSSALPEVFDSKCARRLMDYGKARSWSPLEPPAEGVYFLSSSQEDAESATNLLRAITTRSKVKLLDIEELKPQHPHSFLRSFSDGKGELFYYANGKCSFFCALAENWESASLKIQMLSDEVEYAEKLRETQNPKK